MIVLPFKFHSRGRFIALLLALLVTGRGASAEDESTPTTVTLTPLQGERHTGVFAELTDSVVRMQDGIEFNTSGLYSIDFPAPKAPADRDSAMLIFANGDRISADVTEMQGDDLLVRPNASSGAEGLPIPLSTIRWIDFDPPRWPPVSCQHNQLPAADSDDLVYLANGDQLAGELTAITPDLITIQTATGVLNIDRAEVRSVALNPLLVAFDRARDRRAVVSLPQKQWISALNVLASESGILNVETCAGPTLEIPVEQVGGIRFLGPQVELLSEAADLDYEHLPFLPLGPQRLPRRNRSVGGTLLQMNGAAYSFGLGLASRSTLTVDLAGRYTTFRARVGIDECAAELGHAVVKIEVDGNQKTSQIVRQGTPPTLLPAIDLSGANTLRIVVDYGDHADVGDHVDLVDALLIRAAE